MVCSMRLWYWRGSLGWRHRRSTFWWHFANYEPGPRAFMGADDMEKRIYGRTGMNISILGFGCGAVGGLMVRGSAADQEKAVARALDVGINYFDTAVQYGMGASETNLGRTLKTLKPAEAFVGTKVRLPS